MVVLSRHSTCCMQRFEIIFTVLWERKISFFVVFFLLFTLTYLFLVIIDFVPEPITETEQTNALSEEVVVETEEAIETELVAATTSIEVSTTTEPVAVLEDEVAEQPVKLEIERLDKTVSVLNPESRTIADLDRSLLEGVVRHPDSALLGQAGTVFILGHSSYLPTVMNKNFQAFNGIQNLEWGDTITVHGELETYKYRVEKVYRAKAQDVTVPIAGEKHLLVLATCNSFGTVDDRYIVEAELIVGHGQ